MLRSETIVCRDTAFQVFSAHKEERHPLCKGYRSIRVLYWDSLCIVRNQAVYFVSSSFRRTSSPTWLVVAVPPRSGVRTFFSTSMSSMMAMSFLPHWG